jgi:hypothetical protein
MAYDVAIGWDNRADTALITGGQQALPISNLQTPDIREIWRGVAVSTAIVVDFGSETQLGGVALINSNATSSDTWHIRASITDPTGAAGEVYNEVLPTGDMTYKLLIHFIDPQVSARYLRINLNQSEAPEAGRLFAGPVWFPTRAFSYGWRPLWRDESRRSTSLGQAVYIDRKIRRRGFGFTLNGITEDEADNQVHELSRINGMSRDVLVCRNLQAGNLGKNTIWGLLDQMPSYPQDHPDFYSAEFELLERI